MGAVQDALAHHERSIAVLSAIQSPPELAQSFLSYGRCLIASHRAAARTQLQGAIELFANLGASGWVEEACRDLDKLNDSAAFA